MQAPSAQGSRRSDTTASESLRIDMAFLIPNRVMVPVMQGPNSLLQKVRASRVGVQQDPARVFMKTVTQHRNFQTPRARNLA